ncbi:MAG: oxidoreductase [Ferruginibacter sp.]
MKKFLSVILFFFAMGLCKSQTVMLLTKGTKTSIRGLSAVNDSVVWVSGSSGMVGKSTNGGVNWSWTTVKGFEKTEFRDIEAFDENTAIIMAIDSPAYILRTTDGGNSWNTVYENHTKGMFLDAMDFYGNKYGIVIGDPIAGKFFLAETRNGGRTWRDLPYDRLPVADSGEACFASSGTNIRLIKKNRAVFISGGIASHLYINGERKEMPILQGKESTGANSIAIKNRKVMIAVGGDFNIKDSTRGNCVITSNGGKTWSLPDTPPHGYRSCIEYITGDRWITCGLNGVDISTDNGRRFRQISKESFHVCRKAKYGSEIFFAGGGGRIGVLKY